MGRPDGGENQVGFYPWSFGSSEAFGTWTQPQGKIEGAREGIL